VAVMAAGMHPAGDSGGKGQIGRFLEWQGVHIGPQQDTGLAGADGGNDTGGLVLSTFCPLDSSFVVVTGRE